MKADELPTCLEEAFDFSTTEILEWERRKIQMALKLRKIQIRPDWHGGIQADKRKISLQDVFKCIGRDKPKSKDLPPWNPEDKRARKAGLNYEGKTESGKRIRVKVGWTAIGYTVVTVHEIT